MRRNKNKNLISSPPPSRCLTFPFSHPLTFSCRLPFTSPFPPTTLLKGFETDRYLISSAEKEEMEGTKEIGGKKEWKGKEREVWLEESKR